MKEKRNKTDRATSGAEKKRSSPVVRGIKKTFSTIGKVLATCFFIMVITGCIVGTVLAVNVLDYVDRDSNIDLRELQLNYTTILYATDSETGETYELQRLQSADNSIWVDIEQIPEYMQKAAIAAEDARFMEHEGVDWKRTLGAFVNMFVKIYPTKQGGSTITQQLVKNVTGDDAVRVDRKVREIFTALNLEKEYSKQEILEAYLNVIPLGNGVKGVQAAANLYFGKDVSELSLAECASIIAITQYPELRNPFNNPEENKVRQEYILDEMLELGSITQAEHDAAVAEELNFLKEEYIEERSEVQSYFVDYVIDEVINDLMEQKGYEESYATQQLYTGGYRIYTTIDESIQKSVEESYLDESTFPEVRNPEPPQSSFTIIDYNGAIKALVGGRGEKTGARVLNRCTGITRSNGSTMKPISVYGLAIENNLVTWSTMIDATRHTYTEYDNWNPVNYDNYYGGEDGYVTTAEAIRRSTNTAAVYVCNQLGPRTCFDFLKNKLDMYSLVDSRGENGKIYTDITLSAMSLGSLTDGISPLELAGAYQIYGNGGLFTPTHSYTKVLDSEGNVVLENKETPTRVLSEETAVIVNKMMQGVVTGANGTGYNARLDGVTVAGKTGTTTDDKDQWFVGLTPEYVGVVWMGYDIQQEIHYSVYPPPIVWKNVMSKIYENRSSGSFPESTKVVAREFCTVSGDIATENCPSTETGYYKASNIPGTCIEHLTAQEDDNIDENGINQETGQPWWKVD